MTEAAPAFPTIEAAAAGALIDFDAGITLGDQFLDEIDALARTARRRGWPPQLIEAVDHLTASLELFAGEADMSAGARDRLHDLILESAHELPRDFAAVGVALVDAARDIFNRGAIVAGIAGERNGMRRRRE